ncbi:hypothetical protein ACFPES_01975 [Paenibacillus sp. GCM10023248]|nr:hypothetical protein [Paenibacillus sp. MAHUQ-63]
MAANRHSHEELAACGRLFLFFFLLISVSRSDLSSSRIIFLYGAVPGIAITDYSRQFKRMTGFSPKDYIFHLRVNQAKKP